MPQLNYSRMFDAARDSGHAYDRSGPARLADRSATPVYEFTPEIELAVNVALATARPLLVRGVSGSGKSSLARAVAHRMGWRYYEATVTSRTTAQDLLWTFDSIRRLNDTAGGKVGEMAEYVKPGVLWWAFDRADAGEVGGEEQFAPQPDALDAVVLIDEIDKAEPDVPNNLLIPVGSLHFYVDELDREVQASKEHPPLLVITTNEERQLPPAFVRRCVVLELEPPDEARLVTIAERHFGERQDELYATLARQMVEASAAGERPFANAAEFLDAVWACESLKVRPPAAGEEPSPAWTLLRDATLLKRTPETSPGT
jgi:MoxR-like ATPase